MALLRREVVAFVLVAAAVAVGIVFAVRGCGDESRETVRLTGGPQPVDAVDPAETPEDAVRVSLLQRDDLFGTGEVVLSEQITGTFAVVALQRDNRVRAFAVRLIGDEWRVIENRSVRLRALRPDPGERVVQRTQLAAEVLADAPIQEAGLWMDGLAVPANAGRLTPRRLTMYTEAPQPLRRGFHVVVAFASTAADAAALAWTFEVE